MQTCASCGEENADHARFCQVCGSPLHRMSVAEVRKSVTVLFCDIVESTRLGEHLDPEALTRVMQGYFQRMKAIIEAHGGTVAKFIGDAVLGVFGVPLSHEDDALRAVRAADEARRALDSLNDELVERWGVRLETRTGINTGEVVVGAFGLDEGIAIGDAMNLGARLEQRADPGDILLGEASYGLVRHAVVAEPLESFAVKGKAEPIRAYRFRGVLPSAESLPRHLDAALVGRSRELNELDAAFRRVVREHRCILALVRGEPGVGKTRLVRELLDRLAPAAEILRGRCLSYGKGITFWPVAEIIREAAHAHEQRGSDLDLSAIRSLLEGEPQGHEIAARVAVAAGVASGSYPLQEIFWAVRMLLEAIARRRPLVAVVEDMHWAEPGLFDQIDHLVGLTRDASVLLLCTARPEVIERRSGWPPEGSVVVDLEPLSDRDVEALIAELLGTAELDARITSRLTQAADGNPLFIEQLVAMLIDDGQLVRDDGHWIGARDLSTVVVPASISALLETRLDRLDPTERITLERAAVVGRVFSRGSVAALLPDELRSQMGMSLVSLERKDFVRPDPSGLLGEETLAFRHALIRDSAYLGMLKGTRAELHERFADWLEVTAADRLTEFEEILGHHLEQAFRFRTELAPPSEKSRVLAKRAVAWLMAAAKGASARGDVAARMNLLGRADELIDPEDRGRGEVRLQLALAASVSGEIDQAEVLLEEVAAQARSHGDRALELRSRIHWLDLRALTHPTERSYASLVAEGEAAIPVFAELGDDEGLASAWGLIARAHYLWSHHGARLQAIQRALEHAIKADNLALASGCVASLAFAMLHGPTPAAIAVRRSEDLLSRFPGRPGFELAIKSPLGVSLAMLGRLSEARITAERAIAIANDLGAKWSMATAVWMGGEVERLAGEWAAAERLYRRGYETYLRMGEKGQLSTLAVFLGNAVYAQGRHDEAFELTQVSMDAASPEDFLSQMLWRALRAKVLANRGATSEAEGLGREAVNIGQKTDSIDMRGDAFMDLSEVLTRTGKNGEARGAIQEALALYEQKGNVVSAARARALLSK